MDAVRIRRLKKRYRLPASAEDTRHRLDRIFGTVLDDRLELALERAGVSPHEQICVRVVSSHFRPRLSLSDETVATRWSLLLAAAIQRAAARHSSDGVARYSSRMHALTDMAVGVLRGHYRRAWAWRQLGFWCAGERPSARGAANEMVCALSGEPQAVIPVLIALVRFDLIGSLAARLAADDWAALAAAASRAVGAPAGLLHAARTPAAQSTEMATEPAACCHRILRTSKLAALAGFVAAEVLPALALLVLIESDPVLARRGSSFLDALLPRVQEELRRLRMASIRQSASAIKTAAQTLEAPAEDSGTADSSPTHLRVEGRTDYGGLLFLLGVTDELDLPVRLSETLYPRPLAWALHRLALTLTGAPFGDPGVLAFAGLPPDAKPPSCLEDPPSDDELEFIHYSVASILAELQKRLKHLQLPPDQLSRFVCRRAALIATDPGWIEAHFSLEDVSTELRRARLDLDPGYVPWLGVVVKFVYG